MIGISPAYYISNFGTNFTLENIIDSFEWLNKNNFTNTQLEIFHYEQIEQWHYNGCRQLLQKLKFYNIRVSQFVAHFLMFMFESKESLLDSNGLNELEFICNIINFFSFTNTVTIPLPPFKGDKSSNTIKSLYRNKLKQLENISLRYNINIALEPQPNSLAAELEFLNHFSHLGLNLDPGHLICSGINPFNLNKNILSRVMATHLCENNGKENLSEAPGTYSNDWYILINDLNESGYKNSFDIEIICDSTDVEKQYMNANIFLQQYCIQNNTYTKEINNE